MSRTDEDMISIYGRKILKFILGGIQENGTRCRRSNFELYHSYKKSDIVNFIKIQRIKWADHVARIDENRTTKKSSIPNQLATRRKSRPNLRWINILEKHLLVLRAKSRRTLAGRRLFRKRLLEKAKAHPGLSSHRKRKE
ncbi:uncharacterized protein TNCV_3303241 [Trichonephila clavipes]|nr:uncharacterized protein TNCV_3303241 [Trichonephila clavipes]